MTAKGGGRSNYQRDPEPYSKYTGPISGSGRTHSPSDDCNISIKTAIQNVQPGIKIVKKGDNLSMQLAPPKKLLVYNTKGQVCGEIIHLKQGEIVECIKKGKTFIAHVLEKKGDTCDVIVRQDK